MKRIVRHVAWLFGLSARRTRGGEVVQRSVDNDRASLYEVAAFAGAIPSAEQQLGLGLAHQLRTSMPDLPEEEIARVAMHIGAFIGQVGRADESSITWGNVSIVAASELRCAPAGIPVREVP